MGEGLSSSPFLQNIALFVVWVSQPAGTPYSSLRVWLESQTNPDFHHLAGNCGSDNRDFAFILYAWLGYCCFSPLPWFSSSPGISPDFARYILAAEVPLSTGVTIDADQGWPVLQSGLNEGALLEEYGFLLKNVLFQITVCAERQTNGGFSSCHRLIVMWWSWRRIKIWSKLEL